MSRVMIFIIHDRAIDEEISDLLEQLQLKYYTKWKDIVGVGKKDPHLGDHVWPGLNNATMVVIDEEQKDKLLQSVKKLQAAFPSVGLRVFVIPVIDEI